MRHGLVAAAIALALCVCASARNPQYTCVLLDDGGGTVPSSINSLCPDVGGVLWIGTDEGLFRLFGSDVIHITKDTEMAFPIPGDKVRKVFRDRDMIWLLTDGGIGGYDISEGIFHTAFSIRSDFVATSYLVVPDGILFGGSNSIWRFQYSTRKISPFVTFPDNVDFEVSGMYLWQDGDVLLFDKKGAALWTVRRSGLLTEADFQSDGAPFQSFYVDDAPSIWASRAGMGIQHFDHSGQLLRTYTTSNSKLLSDIVTDYSEVGFHLYISTEEGGIADIDTNDGSLSVLSKDPRVLNCLPCESVKMLAHSPSGELFAVRSVGGIVSVRETFIKSVACSDLFMVKPEGLLSLYQRPGDHIIWIGTNGDGVVSFDESTSHIALFPATDQARVYDICGFGPDKFLLSCGPRSVRVFDPSSGTFCPDPGIDAVNAGMSDKIVPALAVLEDDEVLVVSDFVYLLKDDGSYSKFSLPDELDPHSLSAVRCGDGLYIHDKKGIFRFDTDLSLFIKVCSSSGPDIISVDTDSQGRIWVLDASGLCFVRPGSSEMERVSNEMPSKPYSIKCDQLDRVWVTFDKVVCGYEPDTGSFSFFGEYDGVLKNEYAPNARLLSGDGNIFLAGVNGIVRVSKHMPKARPSSPDLELACVMEGDRIIQNVKTLSFSNDHGPIKMHFSDYDTAERHLKMYKFQITGPLGTKTFLKEVPYICFNSLTPGKYTIMGSSTDRQGRWTEPKLLVKFRVKQVWYRSFLILLLILLLLGLLIFWIMRKYRQTRKLTAMALNKERDAASRQEQLNFLVNLSHELRTPLTLVIGPLERIIRKRQDIEAEKLTPIYKNAERIKNLLDLAISTQEVMEGQIDMNYQSYELSRWIQSIARNFESEADACKVKLVLNLDVTLGRVDFDASKLYVILGDIILNAIKRSPAGSAVTISTKNVRSRSAFRICVSDKGDTFADADFDLMLLNYYSETEDKTGLGMGLAYAKVLIEGMDGSLGCFGNPDGGNSFWFELPKNAPHDLTVSTEVK